MSLIHTQHFDVLAEYKKKLENDKPILNLVVIGELLLYVFAACVTYYVVWYALTGTLCRYNGLCYNIVNNRSTLLQIASER